MTISRRGFIAGVALTGVAVPGALYAHRELTREEFPITPGEATVDLPDTAGQQLADTLRGIWQLEGGNVGLEGLEHTSLELLLDIAPRGRGLRGCLDTPERLRSDAEPRYRVVGDLMPGAPNVLSWRLIPTADTAGLARYECRVLLDEV